MAATNFKTENNTFRKLIGNGLTYRIPRFQRDYSWGNDHWEDLWMDILATLMRSIYVEDKALRTAFAEEVIRTTDVRNNRVVRFILCALERHLSGQDCRFTSDAFNIEDVLPQNAPDGWGDFSNEESDALVYRLGNMTLMQSGANRDAGNREYAIKREAYRQSSFAIARRIAEENQQWSPERIAARQSWMADQATSIWRIA